MNSEEKVFLVGDNPFHGISHLSQERSRARGDAPTDPEYAAKLILIAFDNGANGFMFSVSEKTLSILNILRKNGTAESLRLYAIVPYAYEYVRLAIKAGGVIGLAKKIVKEMAFSKNFGTMAGCLKGIVKADLKSLVKMYLAYEISRIKGSAGDHTNLESVLLHQLVTDMCLGLNMDWLFRSYVDFMLEIGVKPGFNTGNFACLVEKFREWKINLEEILIVAPFNKIGFQMNPSKEECEKLLVSLPKPNVLAVSVLAAGYLKPAEAIGYIAGLPNIKGVAVGVSKEIHARETFGLIREKLSVL
jgi:hypothetical protein